MVVVNLENPDGSLDVDDNLVIHGSTSILGERV
jgi:hypothetical protein